jgi:hypothetical protein
MNMPISPELYKDLKEYWDYQRKIEYNKEIVYKMAEQFENRVYNDFGQVSLDEMKELLWTRVKVEDYEDPPKSWVPENEKYRLWNEEYPPKQLLPKAKKGRPVVLRAKNNADSDI